MLPHNTAQDVTTFQNLRCSTFIFHGLMFFILFFDIKCFLFLSPNVIYMENKKNKHVFILDFIPSFSCVAFEIQISLLNIKWLFYVILGSNSNVCNK